MTADRIGDLENQTDDLNEAAAQLEGQLDGVSSGTRDGVSEILDIIRTINTDMYSLRSGVNDKLDSTSGKLEDARDGAEHITGKLSDATYGLSETADALSAAASDYVQAIDKLAESVDMTEDLRKELKRNSQIIIQKVAVISGCVRE